MRALVIHNFYRSKNASGENLSVRDEIAGLRDLGWDVEVMSADSDVIDAAEFSVARVATRPIHSVRGVRRVNDAITRFRPHVALVENVFPMHSPSVIRALRKAGVPVAAGVRSYRMWCAAASMYRDGAPCRDCVGSIANVPAVRHGCYQGSSIRTIPMAVSLTVHRSTFHEIDAFLAVTEHVRDELIAAGFPGSRIVVRPNFVPDPDAGHIADPVADRSAGPGNGFLFAGRLTEDKGVGLMLEAWERSELWKTHRLEVAGSGELADLVEAQRPELRVEALGLLDHTTLMDRLRGAAAMVVPSMWPEPFGRGVIEAAALGRPSLVARSGGLPSLVVDGGTGWVADTDPDSFAAGFRRAADPAHREAAGVAARQRYLQHYTREVSMGILDVTLRRLAIRGRDLG